MKRAHIYVSGLVQGVFFRYFTQENAISLKLTGFVMNLPNGRVESVIEGKEENILELIKRLHKGPPASEVEKVEFHWEKPKKEFKEFEIKYYY